MRRSALLTIALLATALAPASAHATTVSLESHLVPHPRAGQILTATLTVDAASGERNDLTIGWNSDASKPTEAFLIVTDATAPLSPGAGCAPAPTGGIACPLPSWAWITAQVDLGNGDDRLTVSGTISVRANGGAGNDVLDATRVGGSATLSGGDGADVLLGGDGWDTLAGGGGPDAISGGARTDTVSYADHAAGVSVRLGGSIGNGAPGEGDSIANDIERALGGDGNDLLVGTDGPDQIDGGSGNDRLEGLGGDDMLWGGSGDDHLEGHGGDDMIWGGGSYDAVTSDIPAADAIFGGDGDDHLSAMGRGALLDGGEGADLVTPTGAVVVRPGPGTDHVLVKQGGAYVDTREADGSARDLVRCTGGPAHLVLLGDDDFSTGCGRHVRQDHPRAIALLNPEGDDRYGLLLGSLHAYCADASRPRCALRLSLRDEVTGRVLAARWQTVQPGAGVLLKLTVRRKLVRRRDRIVNYVVSVRASSGKVQTLRWRATIFGGSAEPTNNACATPAPPCPSAA
jgi:Ca2+-binding RTX toxin-like protein